MEDQIIADIMIDQLQQGAQRRVLQNLRFVTNQKYSEIYGHHSNWSRLKPNACKGFAVCIFFVLNIIG
jgi:hypothetical protein